MHLLADIVIPGHHFGQVTDLAAGSDAFVLMTLGFLAFLFGAFVAAAIVLWRRQNRPEPHRQLLIEMEETEDKPEAAPTAGSSEEPPASKPWEREPDWWKK